MTGRPQSPADSIVPGRFLAREEQMPGIGSTQSLPSWPCFKFAICRSPANVHTSPITGEAVRALPS
jgi:hypothetical protein